MAIVEIIGKSNQKEGDIVPEIASKARLLGSTLGRISAERRLPLVVLTGGGSGYPFIVSMEAKNFGVSVYAFPPTTDFTGTDKLVQKSAGFLGGSELRQFSGSVFISEKTLEFDRQVAEMGLGAENVSDDAQKVRNKYRSEVINDIIAELGGTVLVIGGGSGTRREIIDALNKGMSVGILLETGGITQEMGDHKGLPDFLQTEHISEDQASLIYFSASPENLAELAFSFLSSRKRK